jgi:hypothetical protein
MLENTETKNEIFNSITDNQEYMSAFLQHMQNNQNAMDMMRGNKGMMGGMMRGQGMRMMMADSTMSDSLMLSMMKNRGSMRKMMRRMRANGMISEDCLRSSMNMMDDVKETNDDKEMN